MKKLFKRTAIGLATTVLIAGVGVSAALYVAEQKMNRVTHVKTDTLAFDYSSAVVGRGKYLFNSRGCADCHGANGGGRKIIDADGMLVVAPNITKGLNSVTEKYTSADWVRVLRHGLKPDGRPVMIMPSEDWARMSDQDAIALISYASQLPPVTGKGTRVELPLPFKVLYAAGIAKDAAEKIDHTLPSQPFVQPRVSLEHGKYVAQMCMGCHGPALNGGKISGAPPSWPAAANLTPGNDSVMPYYTDSTAFKTMMRTGLRPNGSQINSAMPFATLRELNDTDLDALYMYIRSLPPENRGK